MVDRPTPDLRDRVQTTLGSGYTVQRELPGGGMARVFLAHDAALDRDVVIKVLAPERAASLSAERFTREIRLAAALQEPHIVPVLNAGTRGKPLWDLFREPKELLLAEGAGHLVPADMRTPRINAFLDRTLGPVTPKRR